MLVDFECVICNRDDVSLDSTGWCDDCLDMDRTTDWDSWEEKRRIQIQEDNEY